MFCTSPVRASSPRDARRGRTVDDIRILRIGQFVIALVAADRMPVAQAQRAVVAAAATPAVPLSC